MVAAAQGTMIFGLPLAFLWIAFIVELTPGPNMTYLAVLALAEGRRAGFAAVAGVATGLLTVGLLAAFGVAEFVSASPGIYTALRWAGVIYMLWLAYDIWRGDEPSQHGDRDGRSSLRGYFARGFLTNVLNPKAAVFYLAVLPQFIDPHGALLPQTWALSLGYTIVATFVHASIVALASSARPLLQDPLRMQKVRRILALSLLVIALWLLWSTAAPRPG